MWWVILIQVLMFILKLFLERDKSGKKLSVKEQKEFAKADAKWAEVKAAAMYIGYIPEE